MAHYTAEMQVLIRHPHRVDSREDMIPVAQIAAVGG
jgi:hypothetical protein